MLGLLSSWVLALMQQHWQQRSQRLLPAAPQEEMATQIRDALSHFGASVLSERELEIARLILRGYSSKAMAERLAISPETIQGPSAPPVRQAGHFLATGTVLAVHPVARARPGEPLGVMDWRSAG
ncbi:transcriptional regulator [Pseudomonas aeruginosa]|nr:transcriptional regulator [Pseudomonas aeruginosa]